jgi:hypothetical protein
MKKIILVCFSFIVYTAFAYTIGPFSKDSQPTQVVQSDTLPLVLATNRTNLVETQLKNEAFIKFASHSLPDNLKDWNVYKTNLRKEIIRKAGVYINHQLPINSKETKSIKMSGYTVKNIYFQTRPGIYATANLYIPEGQGPFPGVIVMCGHSANGRLYDAYQSVAHTLALNGYVALGIDPWGAGERTTVHGNFEYHGANLGASLMNIGESLMGVQISDNIRGVDLLCSLPYVDSNKIGATGASGGGNQTMWVAAMDERIKAAVPVVSVGTFESYIMNSNCVCEMLIDGLTFTEEAAVLALTTAIMPCNHNQDSNSAFFPVEMIRSVNNARPIFKLTGRENDITYRTYDLPHGYHPEDRKAMLGWFDMKLKNKGSGEAKEEKTFDLVPAENLMTFQNMKRDEKVISTAEYCKIKGDQLRTSYLQTKTIDIIQKRKDLIDILRINDKEELKKVHTYGITDGWEKIALETSDQKLIPVLITRPKSANAEYVIVLNPKGKNETSHQVAGLKSEGKGIAVVDLTGMGELSLNKIHNQTAYFHTLARSEIWLGKTILGEWVKELNLLVKFLKKDFQAGHIAFDGVREAGVAGLFLSAMAGNIDTLVLRDVPLSYLFDNRDSIDFFSMAIHLPGFLNWGDVSLATALSGKNITFINPVTMSGRKIEGSDLEKYKNEFEKFCRMCNQTNKVHFK